MGPGPNVGASTGVDVDVDVGVGVGVGVGVCTLAGADAGVERKAANIRPNLSTISPLPLVVVSCPIRPMREDS